MAIGYERRPLIIQALQIWIFVCLFIIFLHSIQEKSIHMVSTEPDIIFKLVVDLKTQINNCFVSTSRQIQFQELKRNHYFLFEEKRMHYLNSYLQYHRLK